MAAVGDQRTSHAWCVSGFGGTGKTSLVRAILRARQQHRSSGSASLHPWERLQVVINDGGAVFDPKLVLLQQDMRAYDLGPPTVLRSANGSCLCCDDEESGSTLASLTPARASLLIELGAATSLRKLLTAEERAGGFDRSRISVVTLVDVHNVAIDYGDRSLAFGQESKARLLADQIECADIIVLTAP